MSNPLRKTSALPLYILLFMASGGSGMAATHDAEHDTGQALVERALDNEIAAAQDTSHPMRYKLRKSSPRLTTTKEMIETRDGLVAMLVSVNDAALSTNDAQKEQARLDALLSDPGKQRHRKQSEDADTQRAMMVLRALPVAFLYQDAGPMQTASGAMERYTFKPNPKFNPPNLETLALTEMSGEIWVDPVHQRVAHLYGHLDSDVDFGWGMLGRLYKGGWISIDQADVSGGVWRIVRFQMKMSGRVLFKTRDFDTTEEETGFTPVPGTLDYREAIKMLRDGQHGEVSGNR
jgi:hypothetical protein